MGLLSLEPLVPGQSHNLDVNNGMHTSIPRAVPVQREAQTQLMPSIQLFLLGREV